MHEAWKKRLARYLIGCGVAYDWLAGVASFPVVRVRSMRNRSTYERSLPDFLGRAKIGVREKSERSGKFFRGHEATERSDLLPLAL